jgi:hypothetical protein
MLVESFFLFLCAAGGWSTRFESLWHLGNEFSAQVTAASGVVLGDLSSYTNNLHGLHPSLRAIAFLCVPRLVFYVFFNFLDKIQVPSRLFFLMICNWQVR